MSMGIVQSPGVGRVLEWGALNSRAAVGEFWFFGTVGCLSRWVWKKDNFRYPAVSKIVRMDLLGFLLGCMALR